LIKWALKLPREEIYKALSDTEKLAQWWSVYFATSDDRTPGTPSVGQFENARCGFSDRDLFHGKMIDLHFVFSNVTEKSFHGEQSFLPDGGKSWETNWIEDFTRAEP